jgi:hypothetical protein
LLILLAALTGLGSLRAPQAWAQSPSADYSGSNDSQGVFHLLPNDSSNKQELLKQTNFVDSIESGKFNPEQVQELNIAKLCQPHSILKQRFLLEQHFRLLDKLVLVLIQLLQLMN